MLATRLMHSLQRDGLKITIIALLGAAIAAPSFAQPGPGMGGMGPGQGKGMRFTFNKDNTAGWSDWDRTLTLPVVKGLKPYDADFEL